MSIMLLSMITVMAQAPQGFSYQAVLRSPNGEIMANKDVNLRISLRAKAIDGNICYQETHEVTTSTGGVIAVVVGQGGSPSVDFATVPWSQGIFLQTEVKNNSGWIDMGTSQIMAVPFSLHAQTADFANSATYAEQALRANELSSNNPVTVNPSQNHAAGDPIFTVRNSAGKIVFAVYEDGVRAYVNAGTERSGFVVSDLAQPQDTFMNVSLEGITFNVRSDNSARPQRAGFRVGGMDGTRASKVYMSVEPSGTEILFDEAAAGARPQRAGFRVGGMDGTRAENDGFAYLSISPDSTRINLKESTYRPQRAGFRVGGMDGTRGESGDLLVVNADSTRIYIGKQNGSFAVSSRNDDGLRASGRDYLSITPNNANITFGGANVGQEAIGSFTVSGRDAQGAIKEFMKVEKDKATFNQVYSEGDVLVGGQRKGGRANSTTTNTSTTK